MHRIGFTGDIALSGIISQKGRDHIEKHLILSNLTGDAGLIINLEAPAADPDAASQKTSGVKLKATSEALEAFLETNNIIAVNLANNHSLDYGRPGIQLTMAVLDRYNIPHTGAGLDHKDVLPAIFDYGGIRYALLGYVHRNSNPFQPGNTILNIYDPVAVAEMIREMRKKVDQIIVSIHWGKDYSSFPETWQVEDAREMISAGADIIAGHHPHVIQPFEVFNGRYIFYSLGSLVFGDFLLRGRLRALPLKTKRSFIPVFSDLTKTPEILGVKELKGNILVPDRRDIHRSSEMMWKRTGRKQRSIFYAFIIRIKEGLTDRITDVLFGYYRNPLRDLLNKETWIKGFRFILKKEK